MCAMGHGLHNPAVKQTYSLSNKELRAMLARVPVRAKENDTIAEVLYADSDNNTGMLTVGDYYSILMVFIIRTMVVYP